MRNGHCVRRSSRPSFRTASDEKATKKSPPFVLLNAMLLCLCLRRTWKPSSDCDCATDAARRSSLSLRLLLLGDAAGDCLNADAGPDTQRVWAHAHTHRETV